MIGITPALIAVLRRAIGFLPVGRRDWGNAVLAETDNVPAGRERLAWVAGGLWLVAQEVGVVRTVGYPVAGLGAGAILVWLGWHPGSENPGMPVDRGTNIAIMLLLAALPLLIRPLLGPVADNRTARLVRGGGYLSIYALLAVMMWLSRVAASRFDHFEAFDQDNWESDVRDGAIVNAVIITVLIVGYAVTVLALTSRRVAVPPRNLGIAVGLGAAGAAIVYALMPLGNPLHTTNQTVSTAMILVLVLAPLAALFGAGALVGRRAASHEVSTGDMTLPASNRARQGIIAGVLAGGTAAILLAVVTVSTMLLFPRQVDLKWANPDASVEHGTPFEIQMTLGDTSAKYEVGLLLGPLAGLVLGVVGASAMEFAPASSTAASRRRKRPVPTR